MFGLQMLDVMIGLVFVYVLLALACTAANEIIAGVLDSRTKNLRLGINNLLGEVPVTMLQRVKTFAGRTPSKKIPNSLVDKFYAHPLIKTLNEDGTPPSYIPPATFALAVIDMCVPAKGTGERKVEDFAAGVVTELKQYPDLQQNLLILIDESGKDMSKLKSNLEGLFNNAMERVSGWYKKKTQIPLFLFATFFCLLSNADTIQIAKSLYNDGALRSALVAQAQEYAKKPATTTASGSNDPSQSLTQTVGDIKKLGIKFGWDHEAWQALKADWQKNEWPKEWPFRLMGILITALAVSLGSPFWFDTLNKLVNIRAVGKAPTDKTALDANPPQAAQGKI
jgi:hypothetical protein